MPPAIYKYKGGDDYVGSHDGNSPGYTALMTRDRQKGDGDTQHGHDSPGWPRESRSGFPALKGTGSLLHLLIHSRVDMLIQARQEALDQRVFHFPAQFTPSSDRGPQVTLGIVLVLLVRRMSAHVWHCNA